MKRFRNFLKVEKGFACCFFTAIVVAIIATIGIVGCLQIVTLLEVAKSILGGSAIGVVAFAMLASLYHPQQ